MRLTAWTKAVWLKINNGKIEKSLAWNSYVCIFHSVEKECEDMDIALTRHENVSLDDDFLIHYVAVGWIFIIFVSQCTSIHAFETQCGMLWWHFFWTVYHISETVCCKAKLCNNNTNIFSSARLPSFLDLLSYGHLKNFNHILYTKLSSADIPSRRQSIESSL